MNVITTSMLRCALNQIDTDLNNHAIDITKIYDSARYKQALEINQILMRIKRTLSSIADFSDHTDPPSLASLYQLSAEYGQQAWLSIDHSGQLQLTDIFFSLTELTIGSKLKPAADPTDKKIQSIYFVEDAKGSYKMSQTKLDLHATLDFFKKKYPINVLWNAIKFQGKNGFKLTFPTL